MAAALRHIGYPYTLTSKHCEVVSSATFADDLHAFYASCVLARSRRASYLTQPERAVEHHTALVVGTHKNIELTMKAIRDAVPYINAQAGLSRSGQALVDFYEHSQVGEL